MSDKVKTVIYWLVFIIICLILINIGVYYGQYKDGQIDAINGKIYYELIESEDRSTQWKKIE